MRHFVDRRLNLVAVVRRLPGVDREVACAELTTAVSRASSLLLADQAELVIDVLDPVANLLLVVLHALRLVEDPDDEHLALVEHPQDFLRDAVEGLLIRADHRAGVADLAVGRFDDQLACWTARR